MTGVQQALLMVNAASDPYWADVLLFLSGTAAITVDSSSHGRTLIQNAAVLDMTVPLFGNPTYRTSSAGGKGISIGDDTFINAMSNNEWCYEFWMRPEGGGSLEPRFSSVGTIEFRWAPATNDFKATSSNIGGSSYTIAQATHTSTTGSWYHVAFVRDKSDSVWDYLKLYVDGILEATSASISKSFGVAGGVHFGEIIGYLSGSAVCPYGEFTQVRITNNHARYYANFTRPTAPFPIG